MLLGDQPKMYGTRDKNRHATICAYDMYANATTRKTGNTDLE